MIEALNWKPCPFCGAQPSLSGLTQRSFEEYREEKGHSVLAMWCSNEDCWIDMNLIVRRRIPYEEAVKMLNEKWNRRTP